MKEDIPYLRLVHDTKGGPTDRELEIIQQETKEHVCTIDKEKETHIKMTLDIWENLEKQHHPKRNFHRQYWEAYLRKNM